MTAAKRLAVVFGTYNRLSFLRVAIESAREAAKSAGGCDFIVVDGGSTDGSREWLALQEDVILIGQRGELTGAVWAFNLGFAYAVDEKYDYVFHYNDDAEIITPDAFATAVAIMEDDPLVGEVAFANDLRGDFGFEEVHGLVYANFGLVRRKAGMQVAKAYGDRTGRNWWNPIYRTYGADSEFGIWLFKLGYNIHAAYDLRVHDYAGKTQDELREKNLGNDPNRPDSKLFWARWPNLASFDLPRSTVE